MIITDQHVETDISMKKFINLPNYQRKYRGPIPSLKLEIEPPAAYILLTSGTTGVPKKVGISFENLNWILTQFKDTFEFSENSRLLYLTDYTFDVSLTELFAPLYFEATQITMNSSDTSIKNLRSIGDLIKVNRITYFSTSPAYAEFIFSVVTKEQLTSVDTITVGGSEFPLSLLPLIKSKIKPDTKVFNFYGPTETTIASHYHQITWKEEKRVPIGRPFTGAKFLLLNQDGTTNSREGRIMIGGKGISLGYIGSEGDNSLFKKIGNEVFYDTGNYGYLDQNNDLFFSHRIDKQVSVKGLRIELDEVNNIAKKVPEVSYVASIARDNKLLVFLIVDNQTSPFEKVKAEVRKKIPDFYQPVIVQVKEFILNAHHKLDENAMYTKYLKSLVETEGDAPDKLETLIYDMGYQSLDDLDSLDRVRYFLDVENEYGILIPDGEAANMKSIDQVRTFLNDHLDQLASRDSTKIQDKTQEKQNPIDKAFYDYINSQKLSNKVSETSYLQKNYERRDYKSLGVLDIKINNFEKNKEIILNNLSTVFATVDALRLELLKRGNQLFFRLNMNTKPLLIVRDEFISYEKAQQLMYGQYEVPLFFIVYSRDEKVIRFYFSHHIMDLAGISKFRKWLPNLENSNFEVTAVPSYLSYIAFLNHQTEMLDYNEAISLMPKTDGILNYLSDNAQLLTFETSEKDSTRIEKLVAYLLSKSLLAESKELQNITGYYFVNDSSLSKCAFRDGIGDMHTTIPFQVSANTSLNDFVKKDSIYEQLNHEGKNLKNLAFMYEKNNQLLKLWDDLNFTINYLGEAASIHEIVEGIKAVNYAPSKVIVYSVQNVIVAYLQKEFIRDSCIIDGITVQLGFV
ncbi:non-ribosomal peptide synthetase [Leuconostoc citreum]|uniref:non-ribosomal peptide synthetase n=1 Tax=Leuconostoc citreum TaxID=33964 RepID=UPI0032DFEB14